MYIVLGAPAVHMPSVMPSVSLHRKITGRCVRSSGSLAAGSYGKRRKVSIKIRLRRQAVNSGWERGSRSERSGRGYQEIPEATMLLRARSAGVSGMLHRTIGRAADLTEGTADTLARVGVVSWKSGSSVANVICVVTRGGVNSNGKLCFCSRCIAIRIV